ncbi:MAG: methyltransferase family protein [Marinicella sp.]
MKALELKIPPALLMLLFGMLMVLIDQTFLGMKQNWLWHEWIAISLFFVAVSCVLAGVISFRRAQTTVDPTQPEKAATVVTTGIYRVSRNPMYLGFLMMLLALAFKLSNPLTAIMLPLFVVYMNIFQIGPEERVLKQLFGDAYRNYLKHVRRWL